MTDALKQAARKALETQEKALRALESALADMSAENCFEGGSRFNTRDFYKALWDAEAELENLRAALEAPQAGPVGDHQLASMYANTAPAMTPMDYYIAGIRDAERAHGIGIKQHGGGT